MSQYTFDKALQKDMAAWRRQRWINALSEIGKIAGIIAFYVLGGAFIGHVLYGFFFTPY